MKFFFTILFFCIVLTSTAQNLVANPSFEDTILCPPSNSTNYSYLPKNWIININSADYYNVCATSSSGVSVPNSGFGFQYPATGNAYCGLYGIGRNLAMTDSREYLGCQLISPLIIGQKYYVSFKANLSSMFCATNRLGMMFINNNYFGNNVFIQTPPPLINNFAHIYHDSLITDTLGWTVIKGSFIADSTYQYLLIGNFFDYTNFDSILYTSNRCLSYYYIDDICVSSDSLTCNPISSIEDKYFKNAINIYPNPVTDKILINLPHFNKATIKIYSIIGQLIFEDSFIENNITIDLSLYPSGLYLIQAKQGNKFFNKKITLIK